MAFRNQIMAKIKSIIECTWFRVFEVLIDIEIISYLSLTFISVAQGSGFLSYT